MSLSLTPITPSSPYWPEATSLYLSAFPTSERRELSEWEQLSLTEDKFTIYAIVFEGIFTGILTIWNFGDFRYVEHFATTESLRGKGIGAKTISEFLKMQPQLPVVLEVETPDNIMTCRRIRFYERNGFILNDCHYLQPPYRSGDAPFPLRMMCTDNNYLTSYTDHVITTIHRCVYKA